MPLHPSLALVLAAVLGIAIACLAMAVGVLWTRVRSLSAADDPTRAVEQLARRQESVEARLGVLDVARGPVQEGSRAQARAASSTGPGATTGHRVDPAEATAAGGPTLIAVPSLPASTADASSTAAEELGRRFGAIWALADVGETADSIARKTGQPIGQVELILGLRRQLSQAGQPGSPA